MSIDIDYEGERSDIRPTLRAPSHWDIVLAPELATLFILDAAIVMAEHFFSIELDASSTDLGGAGYPPTQQLRSAMRLVSQQIRLYRRLLDHGTKHHPLVSDDGASDC